jgi:hypothetical protein
VDTDIENRKIRKSENHDIQYIRIYKNLEIIRRVDHIIANHATHQKE